MVDVAEGVGGKDGEGIGIGRVDRGFGMNFCWNTGCSLKLNVMKWRI